MLPSDSSSGPGWDQGHPGVMLLARRGSRTHTRAATRSGQWEELRSKGQVSPLANQLLRLSPPQGGVGLPGHAGSREGDTCLGQAALLKSHPCLGETLPPIGSCRDGRTAVTHVPKATRAVLGASVAIKGQGLGPSSHTENTRLWPCCAGCRRLGLEESGSQNERNEAGVT